VLIDPSFPYSLPPAVEGAADAFRPTLEVLLRRKESSMRLFILRTISPVASEIEKSFRDGRFTAISAIPASSMV
jgi:hypothetical protein